jgi:nucleotide-binding universal stress UspA family protein
MSRLKSALLGSVSDALVREAHRPVLIVPSPDS